MSRNNFFSGDGMLNENEIKLLEVLGRLLLVKPSELSSEFGEGDGVSAALQKLQSIDCVKVVEPVGEKCFVITQKGTRLLREIKNPEKRASLQQGHSFLTA